MPTRSGSQSNGRRSKDAKTQWLDKALEGKPPEIKARVLEIILKMGIDPENEFFVIFVALGQLQVLIEDSPSEWKDLFEEFREELGEWATTNVETLSHLTHKTQTMERLAQSSERLGDTLNGLAQVCNGLIAQLQESNLLLTKSTSQLTDSNTNLTNLVNQTRQELFEYKKVLSYLAASVETTNSALNNLPVKLSHPKSLLSSQSRPQTFVEWLQKLKREVSTWEGRFLWTAVISIFMLSAGFLGATRMMVVDRKLLLDTAIQTQWLLEKANRRDCLDGIKKPNSPECQQFFKENKR
jgi:chromosome segregation ATPase